jgi:hypothetical protein
MDVAAVDWLSTGITSWQPVPRGSHHRMPTCSAHDWLLNSAIGLTCRKHSFQVAASEVRQTLLLNRCTNATSQALDGRAAPVQAAVAAALVTVICCSKGGRA